MEQGRSEDRARAEQGDQRGGYCDIQERNVGDGLRVEAAGGREWPGSGCFLKASSARFADELDTGCGRREGRKDDTAVLA